MRCRDLNLFSFSELQAARYLLSVIEFTNSETGVMAGLGPASRENMGQVALPDKTALSIATETSRPGGAGWPAQGRP